MRTRSILVAAAFVVAGCNQALPDRALVTSLRVLAVRAEPPEALPGTAVHFDALVADPLGRGRPLKRAWAICNPGEGGVGTCGDPARTAILGSNLTADWTIPADALSGLNEEEAKLGRDVYVVLAVQFDDGTGQVDRADHDVAFKRVRISTNGDPNRNPSLSSLQIDKNSADGLTVPGSSVLALEADASASSRQKWASPGGASGIEDARFTWLISAGHLDDAVTFADGDAATNRWYLPPASDAADLSLWVVLRDGRGGIDWVSRTVHAR